MARDGSGVYHRPVGTDAVTDTTIESTKYNVNVADVEQDLNLPRPIVAGGTGANNAAQALVNLSAEYASQIVTNYDNQLWQPGSFYSAGTATGGPVAGHSFSGIAYCSDPPAYPPANQNVTIEARDRDDTIQPGALWVRTKKAGVWSAWFNTNPVNTSDPTTPGVPPTNAPDNSFWWDPTRGKLFIRYRDSNSVQWVEAVAMPDMDPNEFLNVTHPQTFTSAQQLQAATNIGVISYTAVQALSAAQQIQARQNIGTAVTPRGYLNGLTLSTTGSSITFSVTTGIATDAGNAGAMELTAILNKTTAAWAVGTGNGALDTGTISAAAWYHVFLIKRIDTSVVDVLISLSPTAPTLPASYTLFRRIGSIKTAASQWVKFVQDSDVFQWDVPVTELVTANPGTAAIIRALTVPTGVRVQAYCFIGVQASSPADEPIAIYVSDLSVADVVPGMGSNASIVQYNNSAATVQSGSIVYVMTNTSSQIRIRLQVSAAGTILWVNTNGWIDRRGKDI